MGQGFELKFIPSGMTANTGGYSPIRASIFTLDRDFERYAEALPIRLFVPDGTIR